MRVLVFAVPADEPFEIEERLKELLEKAKSLSWDKSDRTLTITPWNTIVGAVAICSEPDIAIEVARVVGTLRPGARVTPGASA
jgi:hypothetical protein